MEALVLTVLFPLQSHGSNNDAQNDFYIVFGVNSCYVLAYTRTFLFLVSRINGYPLGFFWPAQWLLVSKLCFILYARVNYFFTVFIFTFA
jgi:hypothetical protein